MPSLHVRVGAENASVGVSELAADSLGNWQNMRGLTTQWIEDTVREHVCEIAQDLSIINNHGTSPEHWSLLIDRCLTQISKRVC